MGRLIDAEALKESLENGYGSEANMTYEAILFRDMIEEQPTYYDVEMVVEQLEERYADIEDAFDNEEDEILEARYGGMLHGYGKAIDIVKKGGIDGLETRNKA